MQSRKDPRSIWVCRYHFPLHTARHLINRYRQHVEGLWRKRLASRSTGLATQSPAYQVFWSLCSFHESIFSISKTELI